MPHGSDYYKTLGVPKAATPDQVKRAYRRLAKQHHPDRNPGDESAEGKFKEVQQAYDVIGDAKKRAEYDRFGEAGVGHFATRPGGRKVYEWGANSTINADDLEDLLGAFSRGGGSERPSVFEEMFGGFRRGSPGPRAASAEPLRGADAQRDISLTLEQVAKGAVVTARMGPRPNGKSEALDVKIPAGVQDGQRIRLAGRGRAGTHGGVPGDFYFVCRVKPHAYFRRSGADLLLDVPISVAEAVLGAKVEVPTIDGRASVSVPAGTASGTKLRLKGRGLPSPHGRGARGDQYIVISIVPPTTISDEVRSLAERLHEADGFDPRVACEWAETAE